MKTADDPSIFQQFANQSGKQLDDFIAKDVKVYDFAVEPPFITVVGRLDASSVGKIKAVQEQLESADPNQFYYPVSLYHLTILGRIPSTLDQATLFSTLDEVLREKMTFHLEGVATNQLTSSVSAYPQDFSLYQLRQSIRRQLSIEGDDYAKHLAPYEYMGWVNLLRYLQVPTQSFIDTLKAYRTTDFGTLKISTIEVYLLQKRILDPAFSTCIHTIQL
ncbi:hypothetical protein KBD71_00085 [Candidatus Woesebacteria bacterium]|nr:hypothetical protein [Candidatus Woesebacteria bacterium]